MLIFRVLEKKILKCTFFSLITHSAALVICSLHICVIDYSRSVRIENFTIQTSWLQLANNGINEQVMVRFVITEIDCIELVLLFVIFTFVIILDVMLIIFSLDKLWLSLKLT